MRIRAASSSGVACPRKSDLPCCCAGDLHDRGDDVGGEIECETTEWSSVPGTSSGVGKVGDASDAGEKRSVGGLGGASRVGRVMSN